MPCADRIRTHNLGIWDSECDITYSIGKSESTIGEGEGKGHVVPLDGVLENEPVSFIKMDIEGAEPRGAARGTHGSSGRRAPRLAICVYHHLQAPLGDTARHPRARARVQDLPAAPHEPGVRDRVLRGPLSPIDP